jgi:hypothetical protein
MPRRWLPKAVLLCSATGLLAAGCHETRVGSSWRTGQIRVDGRMEDWSDRLVYRFEEDGAQIGLANDQQSLYLLLATTDRALALQVLMRGLQAHFLPEKGAGGGVWIGSPHVAGTYGPPGRRPGEERPDRRSGDQEEPGAATEPRPDRDPGREQDFTGEERIQRTLKDLPQEVFVYDATGADSLRLSSDRAAGDSLEVAEGYDDQGMFVLEMKVPLIRDTEHPLAVALSPPAGSGSGHSQIVDLRLTVPKPQERTPSFRRGAGPGWSGSGSGEGGYPRREGRRGRFGGSRPGEDSRSRPQGLDLKLKVSLAAEPAGD